MKKWVVLLSMLALCSCAVFEMDDLENEAENAIFDIVVPEKFSWSAIMQDVLLVNIVNDSVRSFALDSTLIELYSQEDELLDALIIFKGQACFNYRVAGSTGKFKIRFAATNSEIEVSSKIHSLNFDISDASELQFQRSDKDGDGLFDEFDQAPNNPHLTINTGGTVDVTPTWNYFIFDDLWPAKGDFDFNDFIVKTKISWIRGKNNCIEEVEGICVAEWKSTGWGLGFELFERKGAYLIYVDDVIAGTQQAATKSGTINNGFTVIHETLNQGKVEKEFTLKLRENCLTNIILAPYLYRIDDENHQVRIFGTPPTQSQLMLLFSSGDDKSPNAWDWSKGSKFKYPLVGYEAFYRTLENYPWGIEFMSTSFQSSKEKQPVNMSFPDFKSWVESEGHLHKDWYNYQQN